jgi:hypothetical protein
LPWQKKSGFFQPCELNIWTLLCKVYIQFLKIQIWKEILLELHGKHVFSKCEHIIQLIFFFQNLIFRIYFKFQWQKNS